MENRPNHTIYINNLNEKIKKDGTEAEEALKETIVPSKVSCTEDTRGNTNKEALEEGHIVIHEDTTYELPVDGVVFIDELQNGLCEEIVESPQSAEFKIGDLISTSSEKSTGEYEMEGLNSKLEYASSYTQMCTRECKMEGLNNTGSEKEYVSTPTQKSTGECEMEDLNTCSSKKKYASSSTQTSFDRRFSIENFRNDSAGVQFYTGLEDIANFFFVLQTLGPAAHSLNCIYRTDMHLDIPDQLFIVLIKLRRHTTNFELALMFAVTEKVIANILITWINFMARQWRELDIWPSRELVQYYSPPDFKRKYPRARVIVGFIECRIKNPRNREPQQKTLLTYRKRDTVKVLVGVTPRGLVSFVSSAYDGSTSDRQIIERSSLLDKCEPNDIIMTDRGIDVKNISSSVDGSMNIPSFFKNENRISGEISHECTPIEKIIGLAKTFCILVEPMTEMETQLSSEIIFICFMLCNFMPSVVQSDA